MEPGSLNSYMKVLINQVIDKYTTIGLRLSNLRVLFIMVTNFTLIHTTVRQRTETMKIVITQCDKSYINSVL